MKKFIILLLYIGLRIVAKQEDWVWIEWTNREGLLQRYLLRRPVGQMKTDILILNQMSSMFSAYL